MEIRELKIRRSDVPENAISVRLDGSTIIVSAGSVLYKGAEKILQEDVSYSIPEAGEEIKVCVGSLALVLSTDSLDVFVEELYKDGSVPMHDWVSDTLRKQVSVLFHVEVPPTGSPNVIIWNYVKGKQ